MPYEVLASQPVTQMLRERNLQVLVAVLPDQVPALSELSERLAEAGVDFGLWPMLADSQGRWGSTFNAACYCEQVLHIASLAPGASTIAIDLEPPISLTQGLLAGKGAAYRRLFHENGWEDGLRDLRRLCQELNLGGFETLAAVNPMVLGDGRGQSAWQWLFGTPINDLPFDVVSFMIYTSLIEGYSRGFASRRVATTMLVHTALSAQRQWGRRASLSVGTVGGGALGDERPYRHRGELAQDMALATTCGISDFALFDFAGVLKSEHPQAWLDSFVSRGLAVPLPRPGLRSKLVKSGLKAVGRGIGMGRKILKKPE